MTANSPAPSAVDPRTNLRRSAGRHRLPAPRPVGWSLTVAALSTVMMTIDITIVLVALPAITTDLGLSLSGAQWVINAYSLTFASLMLAAASLSDIIGRRRIFLIGHVLFLGASVGCVLTGTEAGIIAFRALQGAGGALVFGTCTPLLADAFDAADPGSSAKRTRSVAAMMGIGGAASAFGPLVGGALVETGTWEWIFAINIPIGIFVMIATLVFIPDLHREERDARRAARQDGTSGVLRGARISPWAMVLIIVSLVLVNYGIIDGQEQGWTSEIIIASLAAGVLLFAALILFELSKRDRAMVDFRLFRIPSFATVTFNAFASRMFSFGMMPFIILWLAGQLELSALEIGYVSSALAVPMVVFSAVGIALVRWVPVGVVQAVGMLVVAGGLMLGLVMDVDSGWADLLPMYLVLGAGTGLMLPHVMSLAVAVVPSERTGMATGLANTALPLGTAFGVAVYGAYLSDRVNAGIDGMQFPPGMPPAMEGQLRDAAEGGLFQEIAKMSPEFARETLGFFIDGLHGIFIIAAVLAVIGALASLIFIRGKDGTGRKKQEQA
ncbi:MFS transporter [Corynebacterium glyciniphilum]|uniref:MFS transporter n=1 Tax=Corynebacterium glyciniphilum TaxID=1404244 RepID=UPI0021B4706E|nr:MFS transporter [Corynebacterium glyciniphilum]